jgi:hypothetical protein
MASLSVRILLPSRFGDGEAVIGGEESLSSYIPLDVSGSISILKSKDIRLSLDGNVGYHRQWSFSWIGLYRLRAIITSPKPFVPGEIEWCLEDHLPLLNFYAFLQTFQASKLVLRRTLALLQLSAFSKRRSTPGRRG